MPRPRKLRFVQGRPIVNAFIPESSAPWGRDEVILTIEGFEAIRLSDFQGMDQETAANMMNVSRQTFGRILAEARSIVADALVMGKTLRIEGGHFDMPPEDEDAATVVAAVDSKGKGVFLMPGFDGTGPRGEGPMTGGARGYCSQGDAPVYERRYGMGRGRGAGRGFGTGFGRGQGYGYGRGLGRRGANSIAGGWYGPEYNSPYGRPPDNMKPADEAAMLRNEALEIKSELDAINRRIEELESQS